MTKQKTKYKVGDRVTCPACDQVSGTVIEVGYNDYVRVDYDDGVISACLSSDLEPVANLETTTGVIWQQRPYKYSK